MSLVDAETRQDKPPQEPLQEEPHWEEDLKRYVKLQKTLETDNLAIKVRPQYFTPNTMVLTRNLLPECIHRGNLQHRNPTPPYCLF